MESNLPNPADNPGTSQSGEELSATALDRFSILDTLPEQAYNDIVLLACTICETTTGVIAFPSGDRIWFKAKRGFEDDYIALRDSFCAHTILQSKLLIVPDAQKDARFAEIPLVKGPPYLRFYAGAPILDSHDLAVGALGVWGSEVRGLDESQAAALWALSRQVSLLLEMRVQAELLDGARRKLSQAETEAKASAEYLSNLLNCVPDPICVKDSQFRLVMVNDALCRFLGKPREALIGNAEKDFLDSEQLREVQRTDQLVLDTGRETTLQLSLKDATRSPRTVLSKKSLFIDGQGEKLIVCVVRDITEQVDLRLVLESRNQELVKRGQEAEQAEGAAREAANHLANIVNAIADPIFVKDRQHRWVLVNDAFCRLVGRRREELLGRSAHDNFPKEQADVFRGTDEIVFSTRKEYQNVEKLTDAAGNTYIVKTKKSLYTDANGEQFIVGVIRDMTEQLAHEQEIQAKNIELQLRREEADRASGLKSQFLASVSHEFRSPLHAILGFTELMKETGSRLSAKNRQFLGNIQTASQQLLSIINQLLDLSKIEAGQIELWTDDFRADHAIEEVIATMSPVAMAKKIRISYSPNASIIIHGDVLRFQQILMNLISNAIKFTPDGGSVTVVSRPLDNMVEVTVIDSGIGIAEQDQGVVFQEFSQVGTSTRGIREGTGLGLAIVKRLVEQQGGTVSLRSDLGEGSCFAFTLPAARK